MGYFAILAGSERPAGIEVLPFLEDLAADMEGIDEASLAADATRWANALPRAAGLVGSRALLIGGGGRIRVMLEEELATGAAGALADTLVETLARLLDTQRGKRDLVVLLPGPARLLAQGMGSSEAKAVLVALMERVCAGRPAFILLDERDDAALSGADCRRLTGTLKNVADYYGVALGLRLAGVADPVAAIAARRALRLEHLLLAEPVARPVECVAAAAEAGWRSLGLAAPPLEALPCGPGGPAVWHAITGSPRDIEGLKRIVAAVGA